MGFGTLLRRSKSGRANTTPGSTTALLSDNDICARDPLGLTVVYEPEASPTLDIIFVYGLGGSSRASWAKGRDLEFFWPGKWLPDEPGLSSARILTFGYNADFAATGTAPIMSIVDFAKDLLYAMRFGESEGTRTLELGKVITVTQLFD
jgi:hypothetical protein